MNFCSLHFSSRFYFTTSDEEFEKIVIMFVRNLFREQVLASCAILGFYDFFIFIIIMKASDELIRFESK